MDREKRFAGEAIEEVEIALLRRLRDGVDALAIAVEAEERRWRGKVAIPDVVVHALEMPDALACVRVEGKQRVGVEVVADAVAAVEVHDCRSGRRIEDAALRIENHAGPIICGAGGFVGVLRPRLVARFAGQRDGVEDPAQCTRPQIVCPDVARGRGMRFGLAAANDDHVFVDNPRRCERDGEGAEIGLQSFDDQAFAKIDVAVFTKARDQVAGFGVEAVEKVHHAGVDAAMLAVIPIRQAACGLAGDDAGVELPLQLAGCCIERHNLRSWREGIERAPNDKRVGLDAALLAACRMSMPVEGDGHSPRLICVSPE